MPKQQIKQTKQSHGQGTHIAAVGRQTKQSHQTDRYLRKQNLLGIRRKQQQLKQKRQQLKQKRQQSAYKKTLNNLKLKALRIKLKSGQGSSIPMIVFLIFSLICGIIVGAWYLILKPILGVLNPFNLVKKLNPVKLFKK